MSFSSTVSHILAGWAGWSDLCCLCLCPSFSLTVAECKCCTKILFHFLLDVQSNQMLEGLVKRIALDFDVGNIAKSAKASKDSKIAEVGADIELITKQGWPFDSVYFLILLCYFMCSLVAILNPTNVNAVEIMKHFLILMGYRFLRLMCGGVILWIRGCRCKY